MSQGWELLDPELKEEIKKLNKNIVSLKKENIELKNTLNQLKKRIKDINKLNIEHTLMFNQIKDFLEEGRRKYMQSFELLYEKIKLNELKMKKEFDIIEKKNNERVNSIKNNIEKQNGIISEKLFDPQYRLRINNLRWRNNGLLSLINPQI